jgi:hypothetical protein
MGKLINALRQLVKEELNELAAPAFSLKVIDMDKAERVKDLHSGHWVSKLINLIIDAGENGITRGEAADILDMNPMKLNDEIKALQDSGIISRGRLTPEKPEKEPGQRGRKSSDKSKAGIIRTLFQKWTEDPDYEPSEEDVTYEIPKGLGTEKLSDELIAKTKGSALGTLKRGRKPSSGGNDLLSKVEKALKKESLYETYRRLQSLK